VAWQRSLLPLRVTALAVLSATCLACLDPSIVGTVSTGDALGLWVIHVARGPFSDHVQLVMVEASEGEDWPLTLRAIGLPDWNGVITADLASSSAPGRIVQGEFEWHLALASADSGKMKWQVSGDSAQGVLWTAHDHTLEVDSLVGVRISTDLRSLLHGASSPALTSDSTPQILLRLDDLPASDRDFVRRLQQRSLVAELAVPTSRVGMYGRPSWDDLRAWQRAGFSIAAHSRTHGSTPNGDLGFFSEVLGSLDDLCSHGLVPLAFVQPGSWGDSLYFNSSPKLQTWRGSLLRSFTRVFEAYVYLPPITQPAADSVWLGLGHTTISDGAIQRRVLESWNRALQPRTFSVLVVHTRSLQSPDALDWFLDTLATAHATGRIRVLSSSAEARGER